MFFSLHELELRKIEVAESYAPGTIELIEDVEQKSALTTKATRNSWKNTTAAKRW